MALFRCGSGDGIAYGSPKAKWAGSISGGGTKSISVSNPRLIVFLGGVRATSATNNGLYVYDTVKQIGYRSTWDGSSQTYAELNSSNYSDYFTYTSSSVTLKSRNSSATTYFNAIIY